MTISSISIFVQSVKLVLILMLLQKILTYTYRHNHRHFNRINLVNKHTNKLGGQSLTKLNMNLNFYSTPEDEIREIFKSWGLPTFRFTQVKKWVYDKGVVDFDLMNDLPVDLRQKLREVFSFGSLKLVSEQVSKDGTRKRAYELNDG